MTGKELRLRLARERTPYEMLAKRIIKAGGSGGLAEWATKIHAYTRWENTVIPLADEHEIRKGFGDAVTQTAGRKQQVDDWEVDDLKTLVGQTTSNGALALLGIHAVKVVDRWEMTAESRIDLDKARRTYWAREVANVLTVTKLSVDGLATALKKKVPLVRAWVAGDTAPGYVDHLALRELMARPPEPDPTPTKVRRKPRLSVVENIPTAPPEPVKPAEGAAEVVAAVEAAPLQLRDHFATVLQSSPPEVRRAWLAIGDEISHAFVELTTEVQALRAEVEGLKSKK